MRECGGLQYKGRRFAVGTECKFDVFDVLDGCIFSPCTNPTGYTCGNNGLLYCNGLLQGGTAFSLTHSVHTTVCV